MPKINVFDLPLDVGWTKQKENFFWVLSFYDRNNICIQIKKKQCDEYFKLRKEFMIYGSLRYDDVIHVCL